MELSAPLPALTNTEAVDIVLRGHGHALDGNGHGPLLTIAVDTIVSIDTLTLTGGGQADGQSLCGGGVFVAGVLYLRHSLVTHNWADYGGGLCLIDNDYGAQLAMYDSDVTANTARQSGGGLYLLAQGGERVQASLFDSTLADNRALAGSGGGAYAEARHGQTQLNLHHSAVVANSAPNGGGLANVSRQSSSADEYPTARVEIESSTLSGNVALGDGGAIANHTLPAARPDDEGLAIVLITHGTVAANRAERGGGLFSDDALTHIEATIVAGNTPDDCRGWPDAAGFNLDSDDSCGLYYEEGGYPPNWPAGRADLLPLAVNPPGRTPTHALGPNSQAPDAIPIEEGPCGPAEVDSDQRGVARPQPAAGRCDIGAYEDEG